MNKVLIADDEEGIRRLVRVTLEDDSLEIIEASDGEEALDLARKHLPDVVLLDVMMPKRSGLEVCRALKEDSATADVFVVMLTARHQEADIKEGKSAGADDYFTKPFSPVALMRKIDEVLEEGGPSETGPP